MALQYSIVDAYAAYTITLDSLADAAVVAGSTVISGVTKVLLDLEFTVEAAVAPAAGLGLAVYLIPSIDGGTDYADAYEAADELLGSYYVGNVVLQSHADSQVQILEGISLQGGHYTILVKNNLGQALDTGCTLYFRTRTFTDA